MLPYVVGNVAKPSYSTLQAEGHDPEASTVTNESDDPSFHKADTESLAPDNEQPPNTWISQFLHWVFKAPPLRGSTEDKRLTGMLLLMASTFGRTSALLDDRTLSSRISPMFCSLRTRLDEVLVAMRLTLHALADVLEDEPIY